MRICAAALLFASLCASGAAAKPQRIVSLHLCGDQYVLGLAARSAIVSVTFLARDPQLSSFADRASGIPVNRGTAEEAVVADPDLVLVGRYTQSLTRDLLQRFGMKVVIVDVPQSLDDVRRQTRELALALGESERGDAWIARLDEAIAQSPRAPPAGGRVIVVEPNQLTPGKGTLIDELLGSAGFVNLAAEMGIAGSGRMTLEQLILMRPDIVLLHYDPRGGYSEARAAMNQFSAAGAAKIARFSDPSLSCPTPEIVSALFKFTALRP